MGQARYGDERWKGVWTPSSLVVFLCTGISIGNALELILLVLVTFQTRKGLYFWSLLLTSISVLPYTVGGLVSYVEVKPGLVGDIINNLGWMVMITGQSVVLYSRLGILLRNRKVMRAVRWMIIIDFIIFYFPTTIVHYCTYTKQPVFNQAMFYIEKIQMTGWTAQEFIISGLYVWEVLKASRFIKHVKFRRTLWELLIINVVIIILDIALLTLEYLSYSVLEQTFKALAYSYKLKMEFAILGKLVAMAQPLSSRQERLESSEDTCISNRKDSQGAWQLSKSSKSYNDNSDVTVSTTLRQDSQGGAWPLQHHTRSATQVSVDISALPPDKESRLARPFMPKAAGNQDVVTIKDRVIATWAAVQRSWPWIPKQPRQQQQRLDSESEPEPERQPEQPKTEQPRPGPGMGWV